MGVIEEREKGRIGYMGFGRGKGLFMSGDKTVEVRGGGRQGREQVECVFKGVFKSESGERGTMVMVGDRRGVCVEGCKRGDKGVKGER
jgi:hypothetical protein